MHKLIVKRPFFSDHHKSSEYNAGYEAGFRDCLKAKEEEAARMLQQFKSWADLQEQIAASPSFQTAKQFLKEREK